MGKAAKMYFLGSPMGPLPFWQEKASVLCKQIGKVWWAEKRLAIKTGLLGWAEKMWAKNWLTRVGIGQNKAEQKNWVKY